MLCFLVVNDIFYYFSLQIYTKYLIFTNDNS